MRSEEPAFEADMETVPDRGVNDLVAGTESNHRHADFQKSKCLILFCFFNKLPGRSLHYLHYDAGQIRTEPRKIHARNSEKYTIRYLGMLVYSFDTAAVP